MPPAEDIQRYLTGAWRMMLGRSDGLDMLDISTDGFWNSFFAIVLAAPVLIVGWVAYANEIAMATDALSERGSIVIRLAIADLATWLLPIAGLALVAKPAGMGDRFVHYVIASNWGSVITVWIMLPPSLIDLAGIQSGGVLPVLTMVLFFAALYLSWRLTNVALAKGPGPASLLFAGMLIASILVLYSVQNMLGVLLIYPE